MTTIDTSRSVAELVRTLPGAARTFEALGIDYCCRGAQSLADAVEEAQLSLVAVRTLLEHDARADHPDPNPRDLAQLIKHILDKHHTFTRTELARLLPLAEKVERVHGRKRPELVRVHALVQELAVDLLPHMQKEERVLFPYIQQLLQGRLERPPFGTVENPVRVMNDEHEQVGALLLELEHITERYTPPEGACGSYAALYAGLKALQADIHEHVHLENYVLFPAAIELERGH